MKYLKHIFYTILVCILIPKYSFAQLVQCGNDGEPCDFNDLTNVIQNTLNWIFMMASFIVVVMFMYAGFLLITSAGDTNQIQKAKDIFKRVIIGFVIMFTAVFLISQLLKIIGANEFFQGIIVR